MDAILMRHLLDHPHTSLVGNSSNNSGMNMGHHCSVIPWNQWPGNYCPCKRAGQGHNTHNVQYDYYNP
jgi:hypothetical protein